uniref:Uncharacterized protein n=1 Tax=Cyanistes caeruleus TaxID=156563 RepID=A0A8C0TXE8_CYACU
MAPPAPHSVASTLSLYVFENGITTLSEDSFAGLPALQLLDLSQNKITSIERNIFQPLTELVNLDLSFNQLQEITNETFHGLRAVPPLDLPNLLIESLKIAGLGLTSLNEELFQVQNNLHELDVSDNLLERVPAVLRRLGSLTRLSLAGNARISQLPAEDFQSLHNLQELDISNLNINTIPRDFSGFFPSPRKKQCRGCQAGREQDQPLRSHCSWCLGRGGRVTVGTCASVGLGALVLGDARAASLTPGAGSATGFGWAGAGVGVRD